MLGGYYHFYPGDYLRDTSGLSLIEHGAYNLLLHHYYSLDGCVPDEKPRLYRLCGATTQEEQAAVDYILRIYFPSNNGKLNNKRADTELAARRHYIEEQSRKGRLGGRPRKNPNESRGKAGGKAERKPNESPPSPSPSPSPSPDPKPSPDPGIIESSSPAPRPARGDIYPQIFTAFWNLYPRKIEKKVALTAFNALVKKNGFLLDELLQAVGHYRDYVYGKSDEFIKHPASFLSKDRWRDFIQPREPTTAEPKGWSGLREYAQGRKEQEDDRREISGGDGDPVGDFSELGGKGGVA